MRGLGEGYGGRRRERGSGRGGAVISTGHFSGEIVGIFSCYINSFRIFTSTFSRCLFIFLLVQIHLLADRTGIFYLTKYPDKIAIQVYNVCSLPQGIGWGSLN